MRMRCLALVAVSLFLKTFKFRYARVVRLTHNLSMTYHLLPINVACQQHWNNIYTKVSEIIFDGDLKPKSQNTILSRR